MRQKFVWIAKYVFTITGAGYPKLCTKLLRKSAINLLSVDARGSKTSSLKLAYDAMYRNVNCWVETHTTYLNNAKSVFAHIWCITWPNSWKKVSTFKTATKKSIKKQKMVRYLSLFLPNRAILEIPQKTQVIHRFKIRKGWLFLFLTSIKHLLK